MEYFVRIPGTSLYAELWIELSSESIWEAVFVASVSAGSNQSYWIYGITHSEELELADCFGFCAWKSSNIRRGVVLLTLVQRIDDDSELVVQNFSIFLQEDIFLEFVEGKKRMV